MHDAGIAIPESPIRNAKPPAAAVAAIHALGIYAAGGIAAYGWAVCRILRVPAAPWWPLWFCGALLIYNADRIRRDPADAFNLPLRTAASARHRRAAILTMIAAGIALIALPAWRRDWSTLACILAGGIVTLGYSIPIFGVRWKDVPLVKSLFAPTVATLSIFGLPIVAATDPFASGGNFLRNPGADFGDISLFAAWSLTYLLFNMLLCDLRDRAGDARCGIRSIPVLLGESRSRILLWGLLLAGQVLLVFVIKEFDDEWLRLNLLSALTGPYQCWLLMATRRPRGESFYEWAVEGLLYLPALAMLPLSRTA